MSTDRAQKLERLFFAAQASTQAERDALLERERADDPQLVAEVESLLAAADEAEQYFDRLSARIGAGAFLSTPPSGIETADFAAQGGSSPAGDALAGTDVGGYHVIREIGSGGMGSVWLARRSDGLIDRLVALKLPHLISRRAGFDQWMARERQILGSLAHPNIARLYDAGVTPQGRPFLALEFVEGTPIDAYCRQHALDLRGRLKLFLQVTRAVAHAHSKLIIHRDIKPANILVTRDGEVRLLDFGVAKLLDEPLGHAESLTEISGRALTPDYASPEQIMGEPLAITTDVYSLGVVLYELCTDARPYTLDRTSRRALEQKILNVEPVRPSEVSRAPWRKALRGDLDTIVLKALAKRPDDRYATANAFAEDIERHLARQPILAHPTGTFRRLMKFVDRNRVAVGAASLTVVAIIAGSVLAVWQARVALQEKARAEEVRNFVVAIFRNANPYKVDGQPADTADLLRDAMARIEGIDRSRVDLRVELMNLSGAALLGLQDTDRAEKVIERAVEESRRGLPANHPQALESRSQLVTVHRFRGRTEEMEKELATLIPQLRALRDDMPEALINSLRDAAHLALDVGRFEQAVTYAREALALSLARLGDHHAQTAESWQVLGLSLLLAKQYAEALDASEKGFRTAVRVVDGNERHPQVINARATYARALAESGQLEQGVAQLQKATADASMLFGQDSRMVGYFCQNLVAYQLELGAIDDAIAAADCGLRILAQHTRADSGTYGAALSARGTALLWRRRGAAALSDVEAAHRISGQVLGAAHDVTTTMAALHAAALTLEGRADEARHISENIGSHRISRAAYWQGFAERLRGEYASALAHQQIAYDGAGKSGGRWQQVAALIEIGLNHESLGAHEEARETLRSALSRLAVIQKKRSPAWADARVGLGRALMGLHDPASALEVLAEADGFWSDFDPGSRFAGEAKLWLGRCQLELGREREGTASLRRAAAILSRSSLADDRALARVAQRFPR